MDKKKMNMKTKIFCPTSDISKTISQTKFIVARP